MRWSWFLSAITCRLRPNGVHVNRFPLAHGGQRVLVLGLWADSCILTTMKTGTVTYKDDAGIVHEGSYSIAPQPRGHTLEARRVTVRYDGRSKSTSAGASPTGPLRLVGRRISPVTVQEAVLRRLKLRVGFGAGLPSADANRDNRIPAQPFARRYACCDASQMELQPQVSNSCTTVQPS